LVRGSSDSLPRRRIDLEALEIGTLVAASPSGRAKESEAVAKELCSRAPTDAAGYVALAGVYASPRAGQLHDRERAIQVLK